MKFAVVLYSATRCLVDGYRQRYQCQPVSHVACDGTSFNNMKAPRKCTHSKAGSLAHKDGDSDLSMLTWTEQTVTRQR